MALPQSRLRGRSLLQQKCRRARHRPDQVEFAWKISGEGSLTCFYYTTPALVKNRLLQTLKLRYILSIPQFEKSRDRKRWPLEVTWTTSRVPRREEARSAVACSIAFSTHRTSSTLFRDCNPTCFTASFRAADSRIAGSSWFWRRPSSSRASLISTCGAPPSRAW